jgi:hypothetical protein
LQAWRQREPVESGAPRPGPARAYRPEQLGQEFDLGYDPNGYQRKQKVAAVAQCPTCRKEVVLVAETEEWERQDDGTWKHIGWEAPAGVCCNNLIVEFSNGYEVYPLPPKRNGGDP